MNSPASKLEGVIKQRAAPYAAEVMEALRQGKHPNVRLFAGPRAWTKAQRHRDGFGPASALVLPPNTSPLSLRWPRLSDIVCDITGLEDGEVIRELGLALVRDGVLVAYLLDNQRPERNLRILSKRRAK